MGIHACAVAQAAVGAEEAAGQGGGARTEWEEWEAAALRQNVANTTMRQLERMRMQQLERMQHLRHLQQRMRHLLKLLHGKLTVSLPTAVPWQCLPNDVPQDWWVGKNLLMLKEGLHQEKSMASGGIPTTTGPVGGGTSTTLVLLRRTPSNAK